MNNLKMCECVTVFAILISDQSLNSTILMNLNSNHWVLLPNSASPPAFLPAKAVRPVVNFED